jgi:hypothetical protein
VNALTVAATIEIAAKVIPAHSRTRVNIPEVVLAHERDKTGICQATSAAHMAVVSSGEGLPDLATDNATDAMVTAKNTKANTPRSALSTLVGTVSAVPTGAR